MRSGIRPTDRQSGFAHHRTSPQCSGPGLSLGAAGFRRAIPPTPIGGTCCSAECTTSGSRGRGDRLCFAACPPPASPRLQHGGFSPRRI